VLSGLIVAFSTLTSGTSTVSVAETALNAVDSVLTAVESAFVPTAADSEVNPDCVAFAA
jgi:hypothetical protein